LIHLKNIIKLQGQLLTTTKKPNSNIAVFLLLLFLASFSAESLLQAQDDSTHYVLPEFGVGKVILKDGHTETALMNYNTLTEEMIFYKDGIMLALDSLEKIDTVYLGSRIFIPHNKVFYELLVRGPVSLFVQNKTNPINAGKPSGYGESTETGAATNYSSLTNSVHTYKLKLPEGYHVMDATLYWIKKNNTYYKANNSSQIRKIFPGRSSEIKEYIKSNKLDLKKSYDLVRLVVKCNEFVH
jgi:hypothetical protein